MQADSNVVRLDRANEQLRDHFLGWQCRIRQIVTRSHDGRPTSGMMPLVFAAEANTPVARIVTVLCKRPEHSVTMELRHMARRTHDPAERRESGLKFLAERYYQSAREFLKYGSSPTLSLRASRPTPQPRRRSWTTGSAGLRSSSSASDSTCTAPCGDCRGTTPCAKPRSGTTCCSIPD